MMLMLFILGGGRTEVVSADGSARISFISLKGLIQAIRGELKENLCADTRRGAKVGHRAKLGPHKHGVCSGEVAG